METTSSQPPLDDEALLLAYVAGEMPAEQRSRVEKRLAADPGLQERSEALRTAYADTFGALRTFDAAEPLTLSASAAARRFGRDVRAWHARNAEFETVIDHDPARRRFKIPNWAYPLATAAAVILAYSASARFGPDRGPYAGRDNQPPSSRMPEGLDYPVVPPIAATDGEYAPDIGAWSRPNALADTADQDTEWELAKTEAEVYALSDPGLDGGEPDDGPAMFLFYELE